MDHMTIEEQLSAVENNNAVDDLAQRAFAAAVGPDQRNDQTGLNLQVRIGKGDDTPIMLDDIASYQ